MKKRKKRMICSYIALLSLVTSCSYHTNAAAPVSQKIEKSVDIADIDIENVSDNNGGMVLQYRDKVYFYTLIEKSQALYVMDIEGTNKHEILKTNFKKPLYILDEYLFTSKYTDTGYQIVRISLQTEEITFLAEGLLEYVDAKEKQLYYSNDYYHMPEKNKGIFKMDIYGENKKQLLSGEKYLFLEKVDDLIYLDGPVQENSQSTTLSSIHSDGTNLKTITAIPVYSDDEYSFSKERIVDFGICGEWIILSVGRYEGSAAIFVGGILCMKKDGTQAEYFLNNIEKFDIVDDWIYFNSWSSCDWSYFDSQTNSEVGCYRIHPDFTGKECLKDNIPQLDYLKNGYFYSICTVEETEEKVITDLNQFIMDRNESKILFYGKDAPVFEDTVYIGYSEIQMSGDYVYFALNVHGYDDLIDTWRGHTCYYAYYRVKKDGSGLQQLYIDETVGCTRKSDNEI